MMSVTSHICGRGASVLSLRILFSLFGTTKLANPGDSSPKNGIARLAEHSQERSAVRVRLPFPMKFNHNYMEPKSNPPCNHTEQGVIDILHEFGYVETTEDGGTWFTKAGSEYILERQLDLKDILTECNKTYRYLENMGKDVYTLCRTYESIDLVQILSVISDALIKKKTCKRGALYGAILGAAATILLISILRLLVQLAM